MSGQSKPSCNRPGQRHRACETTLGFSRQHPFAVTFYKCLRVFFPISQTFDGKVPPQAGNEARLVNLDKWPTSHFSQLGAVRMTSVCWLFA